MDPTPRTRRMNVNLWLLVSLIAGIIDQLCMQNLLTAIWFGLFIFAFGFLFVRYFWHPHYPPASSGLLGVLRRSITLTFLTIQTCFIIGSILTGSYREIGWLLFGVVLGVFFERLRSGARLSTDQHTMDWTGFILIFPIFLVTILNFVYSLLPFAMGFVLPTTLALFIDQFRTHTILTWDDIPANI